MKMGEFSRAVGLSRETIRFYEGLGLISPDRQEENGYRNYAAKDIQAVHLIANLKGLGFRLSAVGEILDLYRNPNLKCSQVQSRLEKHLESVQKKLAEIRRIQTLLQQSIELCKESPSAKCSTLQKFARGS